MRDLGVSVCGLWMGSGCREGELFVCCPCWGERERERLVRIFCKSSEIEVRD